MLAIKILMDLDQDVTWVKDDGDPEALFFEPAHPSTLGLSASLVGRLECLRLWTHSMVNFVDPHDSREPTDAEFDSRDTEARLLAQRIAAELPQADVWFEKDRPQISTQLERLGVKQVACPETRRCVGRLTGETDAAA